MASNAGNSQPKATRNHAADASVEPEIQPSQPTDQPTEEALSQALEQRDQVAHLLDDLVKVIALYSSGGYKRESVFDAFQTWPERWKQLEIEARAMIKLQEQRNRKRAHQRRTFGRRGLSVPK